jgi:two-component system phosphate regulon response regulator PhoB
MSDPIQTTAKKILLVDDDSFLLDMYAMKFSKSGYEVQTADSTESGLKVIRDGYIPDIMLVDIVMPGADGLEMVSTVRAEKLAPAAVIIMLTNQGSSDDVARSRKLNVDGYIVKATTIPSEVLSEVEKICASKKV